MSKAKKTATSMAIGIMLTLAALAAGAEELKGKVKSVSTSSRTIAVEVEQKGVVVFKYDKATQFKNATSAREILPDEVITIDYVGSDAGNRARVISKFIAPLPEGVARITAAELDALIRKGPAAGNFLVIDSRPAGKFNEGHLPTAISIPFSELEKGGEKLLPADRKKTLVFYCGGLSCVLSPKSAALARKFGFQDVRVFPEGEPGWRKSERPTEPSVSFVKTGNIVLIDLRRPAEVQKGHIPRAVNIPAPKLAASEKEFPAYKGAPIVFYCEQDAELTAALELTRDWGYTNATVFPGGIAAWQAAGNELAKGEAAATITYVRKLAPGEIGIKEFEAAVNDGSALVVDARTGEEFGKGHIPRAINIPAEEMARRFAEIPAGRPVIIHCSTGTRAEMAYDILKEKGITVRYLKAGVTVGADAKPIITE